MREILITLGLVLLVITSGFITIIAKDHQYKSIIDDIKVDKDLSHGLSSDYIDSVIYIKLLEHLKENRLAEAQKLIKFHLGYATDGMVNGMQSVDYYKVRDREQLWNNWIAPEEITEGKERVDNLIQITPDMIDRQIQISKEVLAE